MSFTRKAISNKIRNIFHSPRSGNFVKDVLNVNLLRFQNGKIVKLIGIVPSQGDKDLAIAFIKKLTHGHEITLHWDKEKYDSDGNLLAYVYIKEDEDLKLNVKEAVKIIGEKNKESYVEFMPDEYQFPEGYWDTDYLGNKSINPSFAAKEKPQRDLFLFLNATLLNYRFANFLSMPPNTGYDNYLKACYREA